jgi:hypothetical protein
MKNKFIKFASIYFFAITALLNVSCENDDFVPEFTLQPASEEVALTSSLADEYLLSKETKNNIAERFVWNIPNFGVQTEINYSVEGSVSEIFDTVDFESGALTVTNYAIKVGDLLTMAQELLILDTDPSTVGGDGNPNNTGVIYFRINAYVGSGAGTNAISKVSETIALNINLIEKTLNGGGSGIELSTWGIVGDAAPNSWDGPDAPFYTTSNANVIISYVTLVDGQIKIRENNTWGGDFGDANLDGILDQDPDNNINVTAGTYKITIDWSDNSYTIEEFYWGLVGDATPNSWDGPDAQLKYDYTTDTFKTVVKLKDGQMKFRMNDTWGGDYGDLNLDGILDQDADNNINVTAGYYLITANFNTLEYSIVETDIWGLVGDATPNSWDGPDTKLIPDFANPGVWTLKGIVLVDGALKFRTNDAWGNDFGDANLDGILDKDPDNNIAVTAGTYDVYVDFSDETAPAYTLTKK